MNNLTLRLLSAAVLLPVVIAAFIFGDIWVKALCIAAAAACFFEFGAVVAPKDPVARGFLFVGGTVVVTLGLFVEQPMAALLTIQVAFFALSALFVLRPGVDLVVAFRQLALLVFSLVWVAPGVISLARLRDLGDLPAFVPEGSPSAAAAAFIMTAMTATWSNDTCAYFAGRFLGKHKMAGLISPKKTWEGFIGGAIGTPILLFVGKNIAPDLFGPITLVDIAAVSLPVSFLGPIGDLVESLWKRAFEVKDSGNLIPGHGGMLDRIDAVFFVAPWVLAYFTTVRPALMRLLEG